MHNARNMSMINTLEECLLKIKGVLSDDENKDEGLDNKLKGSQH